MPLPVWLPTWLTNLLGTGWLRGMLGIRKDLIDTKKAKLEVKKLQHEERARNTLITPATMDDVEKYDPKIRQIKRKAKGGGSRGRRGCYSFDDNSDGRLSPSGWAILLIILLLFLISLFGQQN